MWRFLGVASGPIAFALLTILVALLDGGHENYWEMSYSRPFFLAWIAGVAFWCIQSGLEYQRRTHEPTLALKYQEVFDSDEMRKVKRPEAARAIGEFRTGVLEFERAEDRRAMEDRVDDILDLFEDVGFLVAGGQISPEVAHHFFFHWLRGYWRSAERYIAEQRGLNPTQWEHVGRLVAITEEIEDWDVFEKTDASSNTNDDDEIREFLDEEIRLGSPRDTARNLPD